MTVHRAPESDVEPIHDPAHAWNALTVGACTDLVTIDPNDPSLQDMLPVSRAGELSPYSTTSVSFAAQWPLKPDVVFEGGNAVHDGTNAFQVDSLSLLTTYYRPLEKLFIPTWATSAATAQVARFAVPSKGSWSVGMASAYRISIARCAAHATP